MIALSPLFYIIMKFVVHDFEFFSSADSRTNIKSQTIILFSFSIFCFNKEEASPSILQKKERDTEAETAIQRGESCRDLM